MKKLRNRKIKWLLQGHKDNKLSSHILNQDNRAPESNFLTALLCSKFSIWIIIQWGERSDARQMEMSESLSYSFQRRSPLICQVLGVGFDLDSLFITSSPFLCTLHLDGEEPLWRCKKPILMSLDHECSPDSAGRGQEHTALPFLVSPGFSAQLVLPKGSSPDFSDSQVPAFLKPWISSGLSINKAFKNRVTFILESAKCWWAKKHGGKIMSLNY